MQESLQLAFGCGVIQLHRRPVILHAGPEHIRWHDSSSSLKASIPDVGDRPTLLVVEMDDRPLLNGIEAKNGLPTPDAQPAVLGKNRLPAETERDEARHRARRDPEFLAEKEELRPRHRRVELETLSAYSEAPAATVRGPDGMSHGGPRRWPEWCGREDSRSGRGRRSAASPCFHLPSLAERLLLQFGIVCSARIVFVVESIVAQLGIVKKIMGVHWSPGSDGEEGVAPSVAAEGDRPSTKHGSTTGRHECVTGCQENLGASRC